MVDNAACVFDGLRNAASFIANSESLQLRGHPPGRATAGPATVRSSNEHYGYQGSSPGYDAGSPIADSVASDHRGIRPLREREKAPFARRSSRTNAAGYRDPAARKSIGA